jgi:uncharacterized protein
MSVEENACGTCTMCCKVMEIPELKKPRGRWCAHCEAGSGCTVYADRPDRCRDFKCVWLMAREAGNAMPDAMRPDRSKVVLSWTMPGRVKEPGILAHVDPGFPKAAERGLVKRYLDGAYERGRIVVIEVGGKRYLRFKDPRPLALADEEGNLLEAERI